jgi:hypothetical protein
LNTLVGLFLKEDSFKNNPINLFNIVMKEKIFDNRPLEDVLGLLSLLFTYAKKSKLNILEILNLISSFSLSINKKSFSFKEMNISFLRRILTSLIKGEDVSKMSSYHTNFKSIKEALTKVYQNKLMSYKKKYPG